MKTTIALPDALHNHVRKIAIDWGTTMTELIRQALTEKFFSNQEKIEEPRKSFVQLQGILKGQRSSENEIKKLKDLWSK